MSIISKEEFLASVAGLAGTLPTHVSAGESMVLLVKAMKGLNPTSDNPLRDIRRLIRNALGRNWAEVMGASSEQLIAWAGEITIRLSAGENISLDTPTEPPAFKPKPPPSPPRKPTPGTKLPAKPASKPTSKPPAAAPSTPPTQASAPAAPVSKPPPAPEPTLRSTADTYVDTSAPRDGSLTDPSVLRLIQAMARSQEQQRERDAALYARIDALGKSQETLLRTFEEVLRQMKTLHADRTGDFRRVESLIHRLWTEQWKMIMDSTYVPKANALDDPDNR